jgi:hypothetical protein
MATVNIRGLGPDFGTAALNILEKRDGCIVTAPPTNIIDRYKDEPGLKP